MKRPLLFKLAAIAFLTLAFIVPTSLVSDLVAERRGLRDRVLEDVARSGTGAQRLEGVALVLPCTDHYDEIETLDNGRTIVRKRTRSCDRILLPERVGLNGELGTEVRSRGIYPALIYRARLSLEGAFRLPPVSPPVGMRRVWGTPQLALGIGDSRGIRSVALQWNGAAAPFEAGTAGVPWPQGIHADVALDPAAASEPQFSIELDLSGMERFEIVPAAGEIQVALRSTWPHPSFIGRYLPESRTVSDAGFEAAWHASDLGTNVRQLFQRCTRTDTAAVLPERSDERPRMQRAGEPAGACADYAASAFGVSLIQPVDLYQKTYRALHYGILFVVLTFALFFLYEILLGLRVHPMQYALVGIALIAFFVLLLAFAEHFGFALAYLVAAVACIALIASYVRSVLGTRGRAASLALLLAGLYGALYLVLGSEDYALLMGALLLFGALATFMMVTRRLDWYALPVREPAAKREPQPSGA